MEGSLRERQAEDEVGISCGAGPVFPMGPSPGVGSYVEPTGWREEFELLRNECAYLWAMIWKLAADSDRFRPS